MTTRSETERIRGYWDRAAGSYDRVMAPFDRVMLGGGRGWLGERSRGDVLEVGIGTGLSLPAYPSTVRLTGIDLSEEMLRRARRRARQMARSVELHVGDAEDLPFPVESFDTVVFSLSLCSVPDDRAAIREAYRVLRPGGRVVALEHVASPHRSVRAVQRLVDFFTSRLQGDHQLRDPERRLRAQGFTIEEAARSRLGIIERIVARKPAVT